MSDTSKVQAGQLWADRDSRMNGRRVRICEVKDGYVYYQNVQGANAHHYRSKLTRFVRAFQQATA